MWDSGILHANFAGNGRIGKKMNLSRQQVNKEWIYRGGQVGAEYNLAGRERERDLKNSHAQTSSTKFESHLVGISQSRRCLSLPLASCQISTVISRKMKKQQKFDYK